MMYTIVRNALLLIVSILFLNCRENVKEPQPVTPVPKTVAPSPKLPGDLAAFAGFADASLEAFSYGLIPRDSSMQPCDPEKALKVYRAITEGKPATAIPVFDLKTGGDRILVSSGRGFVGGIWALIRLDSTHSRVKEIQFGHKAESDGYGAGITRKSFETQFAGQALAPGKPVFGLRQTNKELQQGQKMVDGVSGATITSAAAVAIVNETLSRVR